MGDVNLAVGKRLTFGRSTSLEKNLNIVTKSGLRCAGLVRAIQIVPGFKSGPTNKNVAAPPLSTAWLVVGPPDLSYMRNGERKSF
jgi:hypothetical protein